MSTISVKPQEILVSLNVYKVISLYFLGIQIHLFSQLKFTYKSFVHPKSLRIPMDEAIELAQVHRRGRIFFNILWDKNRIKDFFFLFCLTDHGIMDFDQVTKETSVQTKLENSNGIHGGVA